MALTHPLGNILDPHLSIHLYSGPNGDAIINPGIWRVLFEIPDPALFTILYPPLDLMRSAHWLYQLRTSGSDAICSSVDQLITSGSDAICSLVVSAYNLPHFIA